jgi:hypothetical protein
MQSKHLAPFAALLRKRGETVRPLLKTAGLPAACLDEPATLVPPRFPE